MTTSDQFNLNIRQATPQDNELLAEIGAETFYDSFAPDNTPGNMAAYLAASFSPQQQAAELADPNSSFLIAEIGDEVVGYARLKFADPPQALAGQKTVEIARFYARKRWIGQGVGARLMQSCLEQARQRGCQTIWLDVWEKNPRAIAFYAKWGFFEIGTQTFQLGDDLQRDLLMARAVA